MSKRAEIRRELRKKDATYTLTSSQIEKLKEDATNRAIEIAFILMLGLPTLIINDKFGKLMKKDGRLDTFVDMCLDLYDSYNKDYLKLDDIKQVLKDEAGIDIVEKYNKKRGIF